MKLRAIHQRTTYEGELKEEESIVIICIFQTHSELAPLVVFVREDGTMGDDNISAFTITDGAW